MGTRILAPAVLALTLLLGVGAPASALETPPPIDSDHINPKPLDPLIGLLAALPTPYHPYTGDVCVSGSVSCVDDVIDEMEQRLSGLAASCSHHAIFSLAYLRVTENVKDATDTGYFADPVWLRRLDVRFAQMHFHTMDTWAAGGDVPPAWRVALKAADDRSVTGLGDFLLNMNAHINNDFPQALVYVGLTGKDGTHKPDHNAYNQRLDSLYGPVFKEEAQRFDATFDDIDVGPFEETAAGIVMRGWREAVWRNAEALANARTPAQKQLVLTYIQQYAAAQANLIRAIPIIWATPRSTTARDDWCAGHHGAAG